MSDVKKTGSIRRRDVVKAVSAGVGALALGGIEDLYNRFCYSIQYRRHRGETVARIPFASPQTFCRNG